jgi:pimeloyl-ACP methyl ester carboxylesterase
MTSRVARSRFVEADGARLYVEEAGGGPAVVFLHPGLWDSRTWNDQVGPFSETYRVVRYDARGFGRSSRREPGAAYSLVGDLLTVLDATEIGHAVLVGCSMGGGTALDCALVAPDRVDSLVLVASALGGFEDGTPEEEAWSEEKMAPVLAAIEAGDLERAQDLRVRTMWALLGTDDERGARIRQIALDNRDEIVQDESGEVEVAPPAFERLEEIRAPTLVLPADHDPPWTPRVSRMLADRIPNAHLVQIPDVDHVVNMRKPAEFNAVVLAFLDEVL